MDEHADEHARAAAGGRHAVVIGASVGGLLAARALGDHYTSVTLVERDALPAHADLYRQGVPQGRHAHGLLGQGRLVLEQLFPGITRELEALGARRGDLGRDARWFHDGGFHRAHRSGIVGLFVSRSLLELQLRRRLLAEGGVRIVDRAAVTGLLAAGSGGAVRGVTVREPDGSTALVAAELVVDASGRGSRLPAWLAAIGAEPPAEERVPVNLRYTTRLYRDDAACPQDALAVVKAGTTRNPRGGALLRIEGDRWILSMGGYGSDHAPTDDAGLLAFAHRMGAPEFARVVAHGQPLTPPETYRFAASVRRRYERLRRFPRGLLAVGDAVCAFNPVYGQGITVAALEAVALREELARGGAHLARRFFRRVARLVDTPWTVVVGTDARLLGLAAHDGRRNRALGAYLDRLHAAAARDARVAGAFLRVANLMAPPASLLAPSVLWPVWRHARRARPAPARHR